MMFRYAQQVNDHRRRANSFVIMPPLPEIQIPGICTFG
jgi:hypothetical protein